MLNRLQPILVTAFFLAMMTLLVRDHVLPMFDEGSRLNADSRMLEESWTIDRDDTMVAMFGGRERGAVRTTAEKHEGEVPYYVFSMAAEVRAPLLNGTLKWAARANRRMELEQFTAIVTMPRLSGLVGGKTARSSPLPLEASGLVHRGQLLLRLKQGESVRYARQPMKGPILLSEAVETTYFPMMREPGKLYRVDVVDPFVSVGNTAALVTYEGMAELPAAKVRDKSLLPPEGGDLSVHRYRVRLGRLESRYEVLGTGRILSREISILAQAATSASTVEPMPLFPPVKLELGEAPLIQAEYPALQVLPPTPALTLAEMEPAIASEPLKLDGIAPLLAGNGGGK